MGKSREIDLRGNTEDRRRRRQWLVATFGDGETVECSFQPCDSILTVENVTVDRYPIPGALGGRYTRDNIRPACLKHNVADGAEIKKKLNSD